MNVPRSATNVDGDIVWNWKSDAFGVGKENRDVDGDGKKTVIRLRFPGQYFDRESGLFYNHHRDYNPKIGRYIQSDPIGLKGGINRYAYVGGNPVNFIDPLGLLATSNDCDDDEGAEYGDGCGTYHDDDWRQEREDDRNEDREDDQEEEENEGNHGNGGNNTPPPPTNCRAPQPFDIVDAFYDAIVIQLEAVFGAGISLDGRFLGLVNAGVTADPGTTRFNFGTESFGITGSQGLNATLSAGPGGDLTIIGGSVGVERTFTMDQATNDFVAPPFTEYAEPDAFIGLSLGGQFFLGGGLDIGINLNEVWDGIVCLQ